MVKVFISHQRADGTLAATIARRLQIYHSIGVYLDIIDADIARGEDLADHIRKRMAECTHLIAVVSPATRLSAWVPWEVGVATEKDFPLATYADGSPPPEFLQKWPYLRTDAELDAYAEAAKAGERSFQTKRATLNESLARSQSTREFYVNLRRRIGQ